MGQIYAELEVVKNKFYQHEVSFNGFKGVDEDKLRSIDALIEEYRSKYVKNNSSYISIFENTQEYARLLAYLTGNTSLSWDDKMLFLIRYYDPELKILDLYWQYNDISKDQIINEKNDYIREDLLEHKNSTTTDFELKCRSLFKIYDPGIIKYEKKLFRVLKINEFKFGIKRDYLKFFFESYAPPHINLSMSDSELSKIVEAAHEYKKKYGIPTINDLAFQLTQQSKLIGIRNARNAVIFMIYILDEQFKAFHIYDEAGDWNMIRKMTFSELGFFNKSFTLSEVKFDRDNHNDLTSLSKFPRR